MNETVKAILKWIPSHLAAIAVGAGILYLAVVVHDVATIGQAKSDNRRGYVLPTIVGDNLIICSLGFRSRFDRGGQKCLQLC